MPYILPVGTRPKCTLYKPYWQTLDVPGSTNRHKSSMSTQATTPYKKPEHTICYFLLNTHTHQLLHSMCIKMGRNDRQSWYSTTPDNRSTAQHSPTHNIAPNICFIYGTSGFVQKCLPKTKYRARAILGSFRRAAGVLECALGIFAMPAFEREPFRIYLRFVCWAIAIAMDLHLNLARTRKRQLLLDTLGISMVNVWYDVLNLYIFYNIILFLFCFYYIQLTAQSDLRLSYVHWTNTTEDNWDNWLYFAAHMRW